MPDQDIYDEVYKLSQSLGYDTYPSKPMSSVPYPFVELGSTSIINEPNKSFINGTVVQEINVWGTERQRKEVSDMVNTLFLEFIKLRKSSNFAIRTNINDTNIQIMEDTSTNNKLYRGFLSLYVKF